MINLILVGVLLLILGAAAIYIVKEKKKGTKCVGCPYSGNCTHGKYCSEKSTSCE